MTSTTVIWLDIDSILSYSKTKALTTDQII